MSEVESRTTIRVTTTYADGTKEVTDMEGRAVIVVAVDSSAMAPPCVVTSGHADEMCMAYACVMWVMLGLLTDSELLCTSDMVEYAVRIKGLPAAHYPTRGT